MAEFKETEIKYENRPEGYYDWGCNPFGYGKGIFRPDKTVLVKFSDETSDEKIDLLVREYNQLINHIKMLEEKIPTEKHPPLTLEVDGEHSAKRIVILHPNLAIGNKHMLCFGHIDEGSKPAERALSSGSTDSWLFLLSHDTWNKSCGLIKTGTPYEKCYIHRLEHAPEKGWTITDKWWESMQAKALELVESGKFDKLEEGWTK